MTSLLITGGRVIDPASGGDARADILIRDGRIESIGTGLYDPEAIHLDATGAIVAPGFIDMHVHLREPGIEHAETIETGSPASTCSRSAPSPRAASAKNWPQSAPCAKPALSPFQTTGGR